MQSCRHTFIKATLTARRVHHLDTRYPTSEFGSENCFEKKCAAWDFVGTCIPFPTTMEKRKEGNKSSRIVSARSRTKLNSLRHSPLQYDGLIMFTHRQCRFVSVKIIADNDSFLSPFSSSSASTPHKQLQQPGALCICAMLSKPNVKTGASSCELFPACGATQ